MFRKIILAAIAIGFSTSLAVAASSYGYPAHLSAFGSAKTPAGAAGMCGKYAWACESRGSKTGMSDDAALSLARQVTAKVNRSVRQRSDASVYGVKERWTLPTGGAGDCEDLALLKKKELMRLGIGGNRLKMAQVFTRRLEPHAVLVLRTGKGDYVLDNLNSSVRHWSSTGYTFVKMQGGGGKWDLVLLGPHAKRTGTKARGATTAYKSKQATFRASSQQTRLR